jgi:general secretion pathway protein G
LVELLVVLGILGILAGLLFPAFSRARREGQQTACASNLRQLGVALSLYRQDYDGLYPAAVNPADAAHPDAWAQYPEFMAAIPRLPQFHQVLAPYTKSKAIFRCPADFGLQVLDPFPGWELNAEPSSYAAFGTSYFYRTRLARLHATDALITQPADTWVLMDAGGLWHGSDSDPPLVLATYRRYNLLLADGHVRNVAHQELGQVTGWADDGSTGMWDE